MFHLGLSCLRNGCEEGSKRFGQPRWGLLCTWMRYIWVLYWQKRGLQKVTHSRVWRYHFCHVLWISLSSLMSCMSGCQWCSRHTVIWFNYYNWSCIALQMYPPPSQPNLSALRKWTVLLFSRTNFRCYFSQAVANLAVSTVNHCYPHLYFDHHVLFSKDHFLGLCRKLHLYGWLTVQLHEHWSKSDQIPSIGYLDTYNASNCKPSSASLTFTNWKIHPAQCALSNCLVFAVGGAS